MLGQAQTEVADEQWLQLGSWASRNRSEAEAYAEEQEGLCSIGSLEGRTRPWPQHTAQLSVSPGKQM